MQINVSSSKLSSAFQILSSVVPPRSTLPILQNVKIEAGEEKGITLYATNLDIGIKYQLEEAEVIEPGTVIIPGLQTAQILREGPEEMLEVLQKDNTVLIKSESSNYKISSLDPLDYPDFPDVEKKAEFQIDSQELSKAVTKILFSVSHEETKYALTGVLLNISSKKIDFVASDGRRLSKSSIKTKADLKETLEIIMPPQVLQIIMKIAGNKKENINFSTGGSQVKIKLSNVEIFSRLIEGKFPDYETVIPDKLPISVNVSKEDFASAIKRASVFAYQQMKTVTLFAKEKTLSVSSKSAEAGEASINIPSNLNGSKEIKIAFNPDFILDIIRVLETEEFVLEAKDTSSACKVQPNKDTVFVIMPIAIDEE